MSDLFDTQGQEEFLNGFDIIDKQIDSILIKRKSRKIEVNAPSRAYKIIVKTT